jgi:hypothetical protein
MGYSAGLYVIPAEKFATAQSKGTWSRHRWHKCRPWFDLGRTWSEFNDVFQQRSAPLSYAIRGNVRVAGNEWGFNFVSPDVVPQLAAALNALSREEVVAEIERSDGRSWEENRRAGMRKTYAETLEEIRQAYNYAAERGAAVGILIC